MPYLSFPSKPYFCKNLSKLDLLRYPFSMALFTMLIFLFESSILKLIYYPSEAKFAGSLYALRNWFVITSLEGVNDPSVKKTWKLLILEEIPFP